MPRKNPFPEIERAICQRLREVRTATRLSRVAFCAELGIDSSKYSNYEHGRVVVSYAVGNTVCRRFDINQRWLATGKDPRACYFDLAHELEAEIDSRRAFSEVYTNVLASLLDEKLESILRSTSVSPKDIPTEFLRVFTSPKVGSWWEHDASQTIDRMVRARLIMLPARLRVDFISHLLKAADDFVSGHAQDVISPVSKGRSARLSESQAPEQSSTTLDMEKVSATTPAVPTQSDPLVVLINRLRVLTQGRRGMKSRLARDLFVTRQAVSNWLNVQDPIAPSASSTLRLLVWVEAEEAKQKRLGSTTNTTKAQTRKETSNENSNQSSPQKR